MTWTDPVLVDFADLIDDVQFNQQVLSNLIHLYERPIEQQIYVYTSAITLSTTSFSNFDATNLAVTLTPESERVRVAATVWLTTSNNGFLDISNGSVRAGDSSRGLLTLPTTNSIAKVEALFEGLTPGVSYTFTLQGKVTAGTITLQASTEPPGVFNMIAWEV